MTLQFEPANVLLRRLQVFCGQLYFCGFIFKLRTSRLKSRKFASSKFLIMHTFLDLKQQSINVGKTSSVSPLLAKAKYLCAYLLVQAVCSVECKYGVRSVTQCSLDRILSCVANNGFRSYSLFTEQEVCMGESWPRSWIQNDRTEVFTHDPGQDCSTQAD